MGQILKLTLESENYSRINDSKQELVTPICSPNLNQSVWYFLHRTGCKDRTEIYNQHKYKVFG